MYEKACHEENIKQHFIILKKVYWSPLDTDKKIQSEEKEKKKKRTTERTEKNESNEKSNLPNVTYVSQTSQTWFTYQYGGGMTGLFRLFRFSRYWSMVWENATASSPKVDLGVYLSKNLPGN